METKSVRAVRVVYCYAHKDRLLRDTLGSHLEPLRRLGQIIPWYDREILPGIAWKQEIEVHLNTADIILLLISPAFMQSDYCYGVEMQQALQRDKIGYARVIPVILRPVNWKETPIGALQALPTEGKPITSWRQRDEAFQNVARGISEVVRVFLNMPFADRVTSAFHFYGKGENLYDIGRYEEALAAYEQAIYLNARETYFYVGKAKSLFQLGRYEEVVAACKQALELYPDSRMAYSAMSSALTELGRHDEAKQAVSKLEELKKEYDLWNAAGEDSETL